MNIIVAIIAVILFKICQNILNIAQNIQNRLAIFSFVSRGAFIVPTTWEFMLIQTEVMRGSKPFLLATNP